MKAPPACPMDGRGCFLIRSLLFAGLIIGATEVSPCADRSTTDARQPLTVGTTVPGMTQPPIPPAVPGQPEQPYQLGPIQPAPQRGLTRGGKIILSAIAAIALVTGSYFVTSAIWAQVKPDSGVAACKAIAEGNKVVQDSDGDSKMTKEQYETARTVFADSRDEEIRRHGTALIDGFWQVSNLKEGEEMGALAYIGSLTSAYSGLAGACSKHGVTLPTMSELSK